MLYVVVVGIKELNVSRVLYAATPYKRVFISCCRQRILAFMPPLNLICLKTEKVRCHGENGSGIRESAKSL